MTTSSSEEGASEELDELPPIVRYPLALHSEADVRDMVHHLKYLQRMYPPEIAEAIILTAFFRTMPDPSETLMSRWPDALNAVKESGQDPANLFDGDVDSYVCGLAPLKVEDKAS